MWLRSVGSIVVRARTHQPNHSLGLSDVLAIAPPPPLVKELRVHTDRISSLGRFGVLEPPESVPYLLGMLIAPMLGLDTSHARGYCVAVAIHGKDSDETRCGQQCAP